MSESENQQNTQSKADLPFEKSPEPDHSKRGKKTAKKTAKENSLKAEEITAKLNGRTLMTYFVLLNKGSIGVRELQRHLALSSPSVARYHLDKLVELQLVENRNGVYVHIKKADLPFLASWILLGKFLFPRVLFVAIFFTVMLTGYYIRFFHFWNTDSVFVTILGGLAVVYTWFEAIWQFRHHPVK
jgi:hypothetical protein